MNRYENLFLEILQQSKGATAIYDTVDIRIAFVNDAMYEIWGRGEEIIGHCFGDVFPEFTEQGFTEILKNVWITGETYEAKEYPANVAINKVTELKYFDFSYQAVLDDDGKTYAIIHTATDVSSRRRALERVQEQDDILAFNNELEVLTRTLSHDLKNPLSIAKMGAQYMQTKDSLTKAEKYKWTTIILDALTSMEQIIGHKIQLNQARMLKYDNECVSLEKTIRKICLESQTLYNSTDCVFKIGQLKYLYGDEGILYQIFFNIISNAVKYSSKQKKPIVEINSSKKQGYIVYTVQDNGIGIPKKELESVFQQFHRASNTEGFPGTGIGLCVVKKIMTRLKGKITLSSTVDKGTTVELAFPEITQCRGDVERTDD
ncbi:PAS domain-containing sensor histidine kinase [Sphingobacterium sp. SGR-19]|uniref:PAS domain-containing sensor histidine kinase n=1 Tax=Sphingobacterium sp. SGR-19 TaxID=2710886 RepID=UPI0013EADC32|nr:PAS domain-containing sensor histidine kinase [Sphingobacterium sp. SGR-19]NGM63944.1 PAS domain-containing protein [Sphingobacterium sp. SGR-19]